METCLLSCTVRGLSMTVEGLQTSLDDMLSLLIHMHHDLEQYLDHNPCQVCLLMGLRNEFAVCRDDGGAEDASIPTPPYQPSPVSPQVPGPVGGGVEDKSASSTGSLPPLLHNSSSGSSYHTGDEVSSSNNS